MGRGLDGYFDSRWRCAVLNGPERVVSRLFPVAMARGKHLFPFRTEQLSPSAPMVLGLHGPGRVGRRRFFCTSRPARGGSLSLFDGVDHLEDAGRGAAAGPGGGGSWSLFDGVDHLEDAGDGLVLDER